MIASITLLQESTLGQESNIESSFQIIKTNILDFYDLLTNLQNSQKIFSVSTDKAANPVNIMGASKRIMEDIIHSSYNVDVQLQDLEM